MATVLITGANRGIGLALATVLANRGDTVIATAREPAKAAALAELKAKSGRVEIAPLDVTSDESLAALGRTLSGRSIDLLIANSGVNDARGGNDDPANTSATWARLLGINVIGAFQSIRTLLPCVAKSPAGKIAIISSVMGSSARVAGSGYPYRASKAAIANVGANLAVELKPKGIAVGIYHPGWVKTDMGGQRADIGVEESSRGLVARFDALSLATTGVFEDYNGQTIPF
ncbi:MAG TPA: SDR family oxidoreductase [Hyphomicrobiaceae bacterium]|nr:SDR family oxidoreductase [Hyphomicrobiaceae bacterium]